jgi:type I site-specific restriction endonuclease
VHGHNRRGAREIPAVERFLAKYRAEAERERDELEGRRDLWVASVQQMQNDIERLEAERDQARADERARVEERLVKEVRRLQIQGDIPSAVLLAAIDRLNPEPNQALQ